MIGLAMMLASTDTQAFYAGNDLYRIFQSSAVVDQALGGGYVSGVVDMIIVAQKAKAMSVVICMPVGVTRGQLMDLMIKSLRDDPATRNQGAAGLVGATLIQNFPCPKDYGKQ